MRKLLPLVVMLTLPGCYATKTVGTAEQMCGNLFPISVTKAEIGMLSQRTSREIAEDTVAKEKWCGARPVKRDEPIKPWAPVVTKAPKIS